MTKKLSDPSLDSGWVERKFFDPSPCIVSEDFFSHRANPCPLDVEKKKFLDPSPNTGWNFFLPRSSLDQSLVKKNF